MGIIQISVVGDYVLVSREEDGFEGTVLAQSLMRDEGRKPERDLGPVPFFQAG